MAQTFGDWLQKRQTFIAVVGPIGAAIAGVAISSSPGPLLMAVSLLLLVLFVALPAVSVRENRLRQGRQEAERCLKQVLRACASAFGHPGLHIRCNIMRYSGDRLRRRVDTATAFNMAADADADLEIDVHAGASGETALHRVPAYGDLSSAGGPGQPSWGLRPNELAKVRPTLKSVLSVPVFDPFNPDGNLLATLQVDSDCPVSQVGFDDLATKGPLAQTFADVVSLLLAEVER